MAEWCYRELESYKYQVTTDYGINVGIEGYTTSRNDDYYTLDALGNLTIKAGYAWDGASGPAIDTDTNMRGSLIHDVLYQMIRERELPESCRAAADDLLKKVCLEDGMNPFRAWYFHKAVRLFGGGSAKPGTRHPPQPICLKVPLKE
jgi:hypothetical protein